MILIDLAVDVTAAHIAAGQADSCLACPVALAVLAALPPGSRVAVDAETVLVVLPDGDRYEAELPGDGAAFVEAFDGGDSVGPIRMTLWFAPDYDMDEDD